MSMTTEGFDRPCFQLMKEVENLCKEKGEDSALFMQCLKTRLLKEFGLRGNLENLSVKRLPEAIAMAKAMLREIT